MGCISIKLRTSKLETTAYAGQFSTEGMNKTTWISTNWNRGKERKKQLRHRLHQSPINESTKTKPRSFSSRDCAYTSKTLPKNGLFTLPHTSPMVTGAYRTATVKATKVAKASFEVNVSTSQHIQNHFMKRTWPKCLIGPVISEFPSVRWKNLSHCQELTCEKHLDPEFPRKAKPLEKVAPKGHKESGISFKRICWKNSSNLLQTSHLYSSHYQN